MLLVRPRPKLGESRHGLLLRASSINGLGSPGWIASAWMDSLLTAVPGKPARGPVVGHPHLACADVGGLPVRYWNTGRPRYCPCCLSEQAVWRSLWELVFYTDCHVHGVELIDECQACKRPLRWKRRELERCDCGANLAEAIWSTSSVPVRRVARELAQAWGDGAESKPAQEGQWTTEELLYRIWLIGAYGAQSANRALKLGQLSEVAVARRIAVAATLPTQDTEDGWFAWFEAVAGRYGSLESFRLTRRFGALYKTLFDPRWSRALQDVRLAFERYVGQRWPGQLAARNRRLSKDIVEQHAWVPLTRACKELGWKKPRLRSAIERGVVRGQLTSHASGRISGTVHRVDLDGLLEDSRGEMTLVEVCARLRIGKKALKVLVEDGALTPSSGPPIDGCAIWRFQQSTIEAYFRAQRGPGGEA